MGLGGLRACDLSVGGVCTVGWTLGLSWRSPCKNLCDIASPISYLHTSRGTVRDLGRCAVGGGARGRRTCRGLVMCASPGVVSSGAFVCMYEARQPSTFGVSAHTTCASGTYIRESTRVRQRTRLRSALDARATLSPLVYATTLAEGLSHRSASQSGHRTCSQELRVKRCVCACVCVYSYILAVCVVRPRPLRCQ